MTWDIRDPAVRAQLIERVACCMAGKEAFPDPCPWHGEDGRAPRDGDPPELVEQLLHPQRRDVEENVVDRGHEVVGEMPGVQERPPAAPPAAVREDPEKAAAAVREALGLSPDETTETVLQEIGLYREHVEKVSAALGLPKHASLKQVLGWLQTLRATADMVGPVCDALGVGHGADVGILVDAIERLSDVRPEKLKTMEQLEQERARRHAALSDVMTLWGQHRLGEEPALEDLLGVAAWLADGDTAPMVDAIRVRAEVYGPDRAGADGSGDAARWTP